MDNYYGYNRMQPNYQQNRKGNSTILIIVMIALLLCCCGGSGIAGIFLMMASKEESEYSKNQGSEYTYTNESSDDYTATKKNIEDEDEDNTEEIKIDTSKDEYTFYDADEFKEEGIEYRTYEVEEEYHNIIHVLLLNQGEDAKITGRVNFYKNGEKIEEHLFFSCLESGAYDIGTVQSEEKDYDSFEVELKKVPWEMAGLLVDVYWNIDPENNRFFGTIENNTNETIDSVNVHFAIYGDNKEILYHTSKLVERTTLKPGESTTFEGHYYYKGEITDFSFWSNGEVNNW